MIPTTYFGQFLVIFTCFLGCFLIALLLSLFIRHISLIQAESEMFSALAVARFKGKYRVEALVLLQAWWRFILMRYGAAGRPDPLLHSVESTGKYLLQRGKRTDPGL